MIKISKKNDKGKLVEYEYNSINQACKENGANSGMNREAGLKYLEKAGFDLSTLVETKSSPKKKASLIEKLMKMCKEIDKGKIKELEKERQEIVSNAKTAKEMEKIVKLNEQIKELQNPQVTLDQVQAKVKELWDEYHTEDEDDTEDTK